MPCKLLDARMAALAAILPLSFSLACLIASASRAEADVPETILHPFGSSGTDGQMPRGDLVEAADGTFYGTTINGGTVSYGTVFHLLPDGTLTVLHNFDDGSVVNDGIRPYSTLVIGGDGDLYGTTLNGGVSSHGTVFKITPAGALTILHSFAGGSGGNAPANGVAFGTDGRLYGVTHDSDEGGDAAYGVIYSLTTGGSDYLVQFRFNDDNLATVGGEPFCTLLPVPGSTVNQFYGMAPSGGAGGAGTVFKITPGTTDGGATLDVLHSFDDGSVTTDGARPYLGALLVDAAGNLYGTTTLGSTNNAGIVYKLTPSGGESVLHVFGSGGDGTIPDVGLLAGSDGNYYGTTSSGGSNNAGTVYRMSPNGVTFDTIYSFGAKADGSDGANPNQGLIEDSDGNLLGMTYGGGSGGQGVIYKLIVGLPNPVKLSSLSLSPTSVVGGSKNSKGTVKLAKPAPSSGAVVNLQSNAATAASVPNTVTIPANHKTATFTITSHSVSSAASAKITATYNGSSFSQTLTVTPAAAGPSLSSVTVASSSVAGGVALVGNRVTLTGSATADTKVALASSNPSVAATPSGETVLKGSNSHSFTITTNTVTSPTSVTITATLNGVSKTVTLTVLPSLSSVKLAAGSVKGGASLTGNRVYFTGNVNADTKVTLTSSNTAAATVPSSETILNGSSSHSFTITTKSVTSSQAVTITAASGGITKTTILTVTP